MPRPPTHPQVDPHLTSRLPTTVLSPLYESHVPIGPDYTGIQFGTVHEILSVHGMFTGKVLNETKAAWRLTEPVESHYD